jgi:phosphonate transport system permease protein
MTTVVARHEAILADERRAAFRHAGLVGIIAVVCVASLWITGFFDAQRLIEGGPALAQLFREMVPPDFSRLPRSLRAAFAVRAQRTAPPRDRLSRGRQPGR